MYLLGLVSALRCDHFCRHGEWKFHSQWRPKWSQFRALTRPNRYIFQSQESNRNVYGAWVTLPGQESFAQKQQINLSMLRSTAADSYIRHVSRLHWADRLVTSQWCLWHSQLSKTNIGIRYLKTCLLILFFFGFSLFDFSLFLVLTIFQWNKEGYISEDVVQCRWGPRPF